MVDYSRAGGMPAGPSTAASRNSRTPMLTKTCGGQGRLRHNITPTPAVTPPALPRHISATQTQATTATAGSKRRRRPCQWASSSPNRRDSDTEDDSANANNTRPRRRQRSEDSLTDCDAVAPAQDSSSTWRFSVTDFVEDHDESERKRRWRLKGKEKICGSDQKSSTGGGKREEDDEDWGVFGSLGEWESQKRRRRNDALDYRATLLKDRAAGRPGPSDIDAVCLRHYCHNTADSSVSDERLMRKEMLMHQSERTREEFIGATGLSSDELKEQDEIMLDLERDNNRKVERKDPAATVSINISSSPTLPATQTSHNIPTASMPIPNTASKRSETRTPAASKKRPAATPDPSDSDDEDLRSPEELIPAVEHAAIRKPSTHKDTDSIPTPPPCDDDAVLNNDPVFVEQQRRLFERFSASMSSSAQRQPERQGEREKTGVDERHVTATASIAKMKKADDMSIEEDILVAVGDESVDLEEQKRAMKEFDRRKRAESRDRNLAVAMMDRDAAAGVDGDGPRTSRFFRKRDLEEGGGRARKRVLSDPKKSERGDGLTWVKALTPEEKRELSAGPKYRKGKKRVIDISSVVAEDSFYSQRSGRSRVGDDERVRRRDREAVEDIEDIEDDSNDERTLNTVGARRMSETFVDRLRRKTDRHNRRHTPVIVISDVEDGCGVDGGTSLRGIGDDSRDRGAFVRHDNVGIGALADEIAESIGGRLKKAKVREANA